MICDFIYKINLSIVSINSFNNVFNSFPFEHDNIVG